MLTEAWNPEQPDSDEYVAFLNVAFGGGWNAELFRWYLARTFAGRMPDRLVMFRDDVPVAGSTVNYRRLSLPDGTVADVGIASGSWTVPTERGQGHFSRMMLASAERAGAGGCRFFLAFVTADNASSNALARCGAIMRKAAYLVSGEKNHDADEIESLPLIKSDISREALFDCRGNSPGHIDFHYRDAAEWSAQMFSRPYPVEVLSVGDHFAIVERVGDTDRLQWTSAEPGERAFVARALAHRAIATQRKLFMYGSGDRAADWAAQADLRPKPGYIAVLPAAGTRMAEHPEIAQADWDVQSGDRM